MLSGTQGEWRITDMTEPAYPSPSSDNGRRSWRRSELLLLGAALALLQVGIAGYTVGVGNQTLQIPFLLHLMDPTLFAGDPAIAGTLERYPSWCYRLLAPLCVVVGWPLAYAALHLLAGWALHATSRAWPAATPTSPASPTPGWRCPGRCGA